MSHMYNMQPTAFQSSELRGRVGAVPSVPRELVFALVDAALRAALHAARVREVGLEESRRR